MGYGCYPTQFNIFGAKLYLSPILDLHDRSLISWNLSDSPNNARTVDMPEKTFAQIPDGTNLILRSDQGWQYQINDCQKRLKEKSKLKGLTPLQFRNQSLKSAG